MKRITRQQRVIAILLGIAVFIALSGVAASVAFFTGDPQPISFSWRIILSSLVTVLAALIVFNLQSRQALRRLKAAEEDPGQRIRDRIERVNLAFTEAATLMEDLQRDLAAQQTAREELLAQAEEQQRLLAVDHEQAENIRQILIGETKATIRAERRQEWMFFTLGAMISIPIGVVINVLVP